MKKILTFLAVSAVLFMCSPANLFSQCTFQVTHTTGTMSVNGINVEVTSAGIRDTFTTYCPNTTPYFIGYDWTTASGTGSYTFTFSPPVNAATLNFSGISYIPGTAQELIQLFINGTHYAIPSAGTSNSCDPMADLTSSGDISGCSNCGVSGWNGTTITGTISSLTVLDTLVLGTNSGGSLFSLFICDSTTDVADPPSGIKTDFYPNPFTDHVTVTLNSSLLSEIIFYDAMGEMFLRQAFTNSTIIGTEHFASGIYFYEVINSEGIVKKGKVIRQ